MDVVHEQCGENKWNARCAEEDSDESQKVEKSGIISYNATTNVVKCKSMLVLVSARCDRVQMVRAVVDFWEHIGGINDPLTDEEAVTHQIGEYKILHVKRLKPILPSLH
ncbi:hypothetical protein FHG87_024448 [Trinorchestia longiramus]|nr:hypothetical protein FHG87_024448 [Trinorchestia longiramus]